MIGKSEEELNAQKEQRKQEKIKQKEERRKELQEAAERRNRQAEAAEEAALKLGKKSRKEWFLNPYYLTFGGLFLVLIYIIVMLFLNRQTPLNKIPVLDETRFFEHNSGSSWKQGACKFWEGQTLADAKRLMSTSFASHSNLNKCFVEGSEEIPESFDTRENKECKLGVVDQNKKCAGSYATTIASTLAEKLCMESDEKKLTPLSAQELLSCDTANKGCRGGYVNNALEYTVLRGLATEECLPFKGTFDAKCSEMCAEPMKVRPESFCVLFGDNDIKREIMKNGPVVSSMEIYTDFLSYQKGIYIKGEDVPKFSGFHTIKIVGWGVEDGSEDEPNKGNKYWIIENSWGEDWGENGYAKISEGQNLFFEQYAYSIMTKKQTEEMRQSIERKQKAAAEAQQQQKPNDVPDMNLDDDDVNNKNP